MTDFEQTAARHQGLVDIGANLGHESFDADLDQVLLRARQAGVEHIIVTGSSVSSTCHGRAPCSSSSSRTVAGSTTSGGVQAS